MEEIETKEISVKEKSLINLVCFLAIQKTLENYYKIMQNWEKKGEMGAIEYFEKITQECVQIVEITNKDLDSLVDYVLNELINK